MQNANAIKINTVVTGRDVAKISIAPTQSASAIKTNAVITGRDVAKISIAPTQNASAIKNPSKHTGRADATTITLSVATKLKVLIWMMKSDKISR